MAVPMTLTAIGRYLLPVVCLTWCLACDSGRRPADTPAGDGGFGDASLHGAGIYSISWGNSADSDILLTGTDEQKADFLQANHPQVRVVGLNALWSQLNPKDPESHGSYQPNDPANPAYDWRLVDETIRIAAQSNKQVLVRVIGGLDKRYTPDWVWNKGGFDWIEYTHKTTLLKAVPAVWAPAFQQRWGTFVRAFGRRYDANPHLHRVGINLHAYEMFYIRDQQRLAEAVARLGFTAAKYQAAFNWNVELFAQAFPHKALFKDLAEIVDVPNREIDAVVSSTEERAAIKSLSDDVAYQALATVGPRLCLQSDGLHGSGATTGYNDTYLPNPAYRPEQVGPSGRLRVMLTAAPTNPIGFETLMPGHNGDFAELVDVAIAWPVAYVGLFTKDLRDPALQVDIARLAAALAAHRP